MPKLNVTLDQVVTGIHWAMLREQKNSLAYTIAEAVARDDVARAKKLTGLLHLIDALQDAAVTEDFATEAEVFGLQEGS